MDDLKFSSILPIEVPVTFGEETYTLKEASGDLTDEYKRTISSFAKVEGGKVTVDKPQEALAATQEAGKKLLADCLHDPEGSQVGIEFVRNLPGRIRDKLVETLLEMSGVDLGKEGDKLAAKNS